MRNIAKILSSAATIAAVSFAATPAFAAGTTAGTTIRNEVTVNYRIGTVDQNAAADSDEFVVDRKVIFTVSEVGNAATIVSPGATQQVTTFQVSNQSNDTIDVALALTQLPDGSTAAFGGTDSFDVTSSSIKIYRDNGDGSFGAGDEEITYVDQLAADQNATVFVVADIPLGLASDSIATVVLTGTAHEGDAADALGTQLQTSATNSPNQVDTVLADLSGTDDADYDGQFSARDDYKVLAAALIVNKTSSIVSDPVSGTSNPKAIPGAIIEYCIAVANGDGSATATGVSVTDTLPANVSFIDNSILLDGTVDASNICQSDGTPGGNFDGTNVTGSLSDIAGGETRTLVFRAEID